MSRNASLGLDVLSSLLYALSLICIILEAWGNETLYYIAWIVFVVSVVMFAFVLYNKWQQRHNILQKRRHQIIIALSSVVLPTLLIGLWLNRSAPYQELIGLYLCTATYIALLANSLYMLNRKKSA